MPNTPILVGVIGRPHGVRGQLHVHSYTAEPRDLAAYGVLDSADGRRFTLNWVAGDVAEVKEVVSGTVRPVLDRNAAERLTNLQLFVDRANLPRPAADEFYISDLIGLQAVSVDGAVLGQVAAIHDYGAGTSIEVATQTAPLLLPFTRACVPDVDMASRRVVICLPDELIVEDADFEGASA